MPRAPPLPLLLPLPAEQYQKVQNGLVLIPRAPLCTRTFFFFIVVVVCAVVDISADDDDDDEASTVTSFLAGRSPFGVQYIYLRRGTTKNGSAGDPRSRAVSRCQ